MKIFKPCQKSRAFTLIELMVVIVTIALLAAFFIPAVLRNGPAALRARCVDNLKQVGLAFRVNMGESPYNVMRRSTNAGGTMEYVAGGNAFRHFQCLTNEATIDVRIFICPADNRDAAANFSKFSDANVSYFVGVDAEEAMPNMLLDGDRNLMTNGVALRTGLVSLGSMEKIGWSGQMHKFCGNIGLSDGSVRQVDTERVQALLMRTGTNVNRLAIP